MPGRYSPCPLLAATGWYCPFCGGLRALHALTRLDVAGSVGWNALAIPLLLLALASWVRWLTWARRARSGRRTPAPWRPFSPRWAVWALCLTLTTYGVARNLPPLSFLAPHG